MFELHNRRTLCAECERRTDVALTISELAQETGPKIDSLHDHLSWERIVGLADNLGTTPSELLRSTPIRTRHPEPKRRSSQ